MELSLNKIFGLIRKNIWIILIFAFVGLTAAFLYTKMFIKPVYIASVKMYAYEEDANKNNAARLTELNYNQRIVNTYIEMLDTVDFYNSVKNDSNLNCSAEQLRNMIDFQVMNETEIFKIEVSADSPELAKLIADTTSPVAISTIKSIQESATIKQVEGATFPSSASDYNIKTNCIAGFMIGVVLAIIIVFLKDVLDIKVKSEEDLFERYTLPILSVIPNFEED